MKRLTVIAALLSALAVGPALAEEGDAAKGKKVFKKCKACHVVEDGAKSKLGPNLYNIWDREAGKVDDFKYSKALLAMAEEGLVWDEESLRAFLEKPKKFMKGTKMTFPGIKQSKPKGQKQMTDLMAYLKEISPDAPAE